MTLPPVPLSVLVPTKNEQRNIVRCLGHLQWAEELVVYDSYSTDGTVDLARGQGARVIQRQFDNFADHKNWALDNIPFRHPWILIVDADEVIPAELAAEIRDLFRHPHQYDGYYIARKNYFAGKWVRHGGWYPNWNLRLLRIGRGRYERRLVHEHILLDGRPGFLRHPLVHNDYKGIERYFERHNHYSTLEAVEAYRTIHGGERPTTIPALLNAKGPERRRFLKNLAYRYLPARPLIKFLWMYVLRLGLLDGRIGFRYCLLHTFYEVQISLKLRELADPESPLALEYKDYLGRN